MTSKRILSLLLTPLFLVAFSTAAWATDSDSDGLSDDLETAYGTDPNDSDSDDDSLSDGVEVTDTGTDPNMADTDGDSEDDDEDDDPLDPGTFDGVTAVSGTGYPTSINRALAGTSSVDGVGVYVHDGHLTYSANVGGAKGVKLPFSFPLYYDSSWDYDGNVGWNWSSAIDTTYTATSTSFKVRRPPQGEIEWVKTGEPPVWVPQEDSLNALTESGGVFTETSPSGFQWVYSSGQLDQVRDKHGNTIDSRTTRTDSPRPPPTRAASRTRSATTRPPGA